MCILFFIKETQKNNLKKKQKERLRSSEPRGSRRSSSVLAHIGRPVEYVSRAVLFFLSTLHTIDICGDVALRFKPGVEPFLSNFVRKKKPKRIVFRMPEVVLWAVSTQNTARDARAKRDPTRRNDSERV